MEFDVRCYEEAQSEGRSSLKAVSDDIELLDLKESYYLTLLLEDDQLSVKISNFKTLPNAPAQDQYLGIAKQVITSAPVILWDFKADKLTWETRHTKGPDVESTFTREADIIATATEILEQSDVVATFVQKASNALVNHLDAKIADAWKMAHDLFETRARAKLLKDHLPTLKVRRTLQVRDDAYIRFGDLMGETSSTPPDEPLDEIFAQGVKSVHIEMMSEDHAWFGIHLINGRYFHGAFSGKGLRVTSHEETDV